MPPQKLCTTDIDPLPPIIADYLNRLPEPLVDYFEEPVTEESFYSQHRNTETPNTGFKAEPIEPRNERWLPVFNTENLSAIGIEASYESRESLRFSIEEFVKSASEHDGFREAPAFDVDVLTLGLRALGEEMPNFMPVIDYLLAELGFVLTGEAKDFRIGSIILTGEPGVGKTRFVRKLAKVLGVLLEKVAVGALQNSAELCGASRSWSTSHPGLIAQAIAKSTTVSPLFLWDEIDKVTINRDHPIVPTLLELFEPDSAADFKDVCLNLRFDTSHFIHIATANDIDMVPGPLRSRFHVIEIKSPDAEQRKVIIANLFKELIGKRDFEVGADVIDKIAELDVDLRELQRQLKSSVGFALFNNERCLTIDHLKFKAPERRGIGFIY